MWEYDKKLIKEYRDCMDTFLAEVKEGGEVDYASACSVEAAQLQSYITKVTTNYQRKFYPSMNENKTKLFDPKLPYFQDL